MFNLIDDNAKYIKEVEDDTQVPISLDKYKDYLSERTEKADRYDEIMEEPIIGFSLINLPQDLDYIQEDSSRIARNDAWVESLHKDVYLEEAVMIMNDLINEKQ